MNQALNELLDKQAILEVINRYCRAVDRCDEEMLRTVFHPDAHVEQVGRQFTGETVAPGIVEWMLESMDLTTHHITTHHILIDEEGAGCESYYVGIHLPKRGESGASGMIISTGRYLDRLEKRDGQWRIVRRVAVNEASRQLPPEDDGSTKRPRLSRRDLTDPSYLLFDDRSP